MASRTRSIEIVQHYPYPIELVWEAIATREAMNQWLMETDFVPELGRKFQLRAKPMKQWRGYVDCAVLEITPPTRLKYSWQGMPEHNPSIVTYELSPEKDGTRLRVVHEGFDSSYGFMSGLLIRGIMGSGWRHKLRDLMPLVLANVAGRHGLPVSKAHCQ